MSRPTTLRLADLRDLTDAELRRHIFVRYMRPSTDDVAWAEATGAGWVDLADDDAFQTDPEPAFVDAIPTDDELAQRIGTVLVAYESVGDYGCDSSAYFLLERDGELYEVHGSHDSTCGFEGQWEPTLVTPSYLVSEHWRMSVGGYDEHRGSHPAWDCDTCEGEGYVFAEDGYTVCRMCDGTGRKPDVPATDLSTRDVVRAWLHHRFGGELAELPFVLPEWAIPTWARHVDKQGNAVDLRAVDDRYLLNIVRWACRKVRGHWRKRYVQREEPPARGSFLNGMREAEARGLLPTWDELRVAGDLAELRGAMVHRPIAADEVACVPIEGGPWDLVDLWVGYKLLACSDVSG